MPFEPEQDDRKVAAYVGLPEGRRFDLPDILRSGVVIPGAEDYWIIQWGSRVDWDLDLDGPPSEWPSVTFREMRGLDPADVTAHTYQLWLIQCYRPGYPLAAERRWHPDLGIRDAIVGLEDQTATREHVLAAWRGHALIMAHLRCDPWPRSATQNDFIRERGRRLALYCRDRGISDPTPLDRQAVAEAVGYASVQSLANACHTKGVIPDQIKSEAYHQLRAETR